MSQTIEDLEWKINEIEQRLESRISRLESKLSSLDNECSNKPDNYDLDREVGNLRSDLQSLEHKVDYS